MTEAEIINWVCRENRLIETVQRGFDFASSRPSASLSRGANKRKIFADVALPQSALADRNSRRHQQFASGLFEEQSRGELHKTKPTKENRKDAQAAKIT